MKRRLLGILAFEGCIEAYNGDLPLVARFCPNEQLLNRLTEGGGERSGPPAVLFASTLQQPELWRLAKLVVRTAQCGSAEPWIPSLCCIYRGDEQSQRTVLL
jgi:hypothetical protein